MTVSITADALPNLARYVEALPDVTLDAARIAINDVAKGPGLKLLRDGAQHEINFPPGYVSETDGRGNQRIYLKQSAHKQRLEAKIAARSRPTSLARFAGRGQTPENTRRVGVKVAVKRGSQEVMKSAFLMRLRVGNELSDSLHNVGLAIRLKPGERVRNKKKQVGSDPNLYLLYGPSVDQVFRATMVEQKPKILDMVETQFYRQFNRLSGAF